MKFTAALSMIAFAPAASACSLGYMLWNTKDSVPIKMLDKYDSVIDLCETGEYLSIEAVRQDGTESCWADGVTFKLFDMYGMKLDKNRETVMPYFLNANVGTDVNPSMYLAKEGMYTLKGKAFPSMDVTELEFTVKKCMDTPPGGMGDPHFKTWNRQVYDFQGECDLVLLQNPNFSSGLGMDIHIRTQITAMWSSIKTAVLRIGDNTFEVRSSQDNNDSITWSNGVANGATVPSTFAGYPLTHRAEPQGDGTLHVFTIDLGNDEKIIMKSFKQLVDVLIKGAESDMFEGSMGLLGSFETGEMIGRDGVSILEDGVAFGQEWQVLDSESKLFSTVEGPQHPAQCRMPSANSRQLKEASVVSEAEAEAACSHVSEGDRPNCVSDVVVMGDVSIASMY